MQNNIELTTIKLVNIKPYWRNARKNKETIELLKKSISEYGFVNPILVDSNNVIIAGHARYSALVQLGYKEAKCIVLSDLSEIEAKRLRIIDNKIPEYTQWDFKDLGIELREIRCE